MVLLHGTNRNADHYFTTAVTAAFIAGALEENEYREKLAAAGFESIDVEPTRIYSARDALSFLLDKGVDVESFGTQMDGKFMSAFIRARKPQAGERACCGPACCS